MENPFAIFNEQSKLFAGMAADRNRDAREEAKLGMLARQADFERAVETEKLGMLQESHALGLQAKGLEIDVARKNLSEANLAIQARGLALEDARRKQEDSMFSGAFLSSLGTQGIDGVTDQESANAFISKVERDNAAELAAFPSARVALRAAVTDQLTRHAATMAGLGDAANKATLLQMRADYTSLATKHKFPAQSWVEEAILDKRHPRHAQAYNEITRVRALDDKLGSDALAATRERAERLGQPTKTEVDSSGNILKLTVEDTAEAIKARKERRDIKVPMGDRGNLVTVTQENYELTRPFLASDPKYADKLEQADRDYQYVDPARADETVRISDFGSGPDAVKAAAARVDALLKSGKTVRTIDPGGTMMLFGPKGKSSEAGGGEEAATGDGPGYSEGSSGGTPRAASPAEPRAEPLPAAIASDPAAVAKEAERKRVADEISAKATKAKAEYDAAAKELKATDAHIAKITNLLYSARPASSATAISETIRGVTPSGAKLRAIDIERLRIAKLKRAAQAKQLEKLKKSLDEAATGG